MLIGHSMPAVTTATLSSGSWLVADAGAALYDGKPTRKAGISWPAGTPAITQYVGITLGFATATRLRVLAALGLSVPAGTRIEFYGPAAQGLGGNTAGDRARVMADGTIGLFCVADDTGIEDSSLQVRIYNDCNGATWATGGTALYIGELFAGDGHTIGLADGWAVSTVDPSESYRTRGSQLNTVRRSAYRQLNAQLGGMSLARARAGGLEHGLDLDRITSALRGGARCIAIPHYRDLTTKALDASVANRSALYGYAAQLPDIANISRGWFNGQIVVEEIPAA